MHPFYTVHTLHHEMARAVLQRLAQAALGPSQSNGVLCHECSDCHHMSSSDTAC